MGNISNFDYKRHQLGLSKELSVFSIVELYKKSGFKVKLDCLAVITVIKSTESNYQEALQLIYKYEGVENTESLLSKLNTQVMESQVLIASEKSKPLEENNTNKALTEQINNPSSGIVQWLTNNKATTIVFTFLIIVGILSIFRNDPEPSPNTAIVSTNTVPDVEEKFISLTDKNGHKFVNVFINNSFSIFLLDTGASTTLISVDYLNQLIKDGFINKKSNFLGAGKFKIADGSSVKGEIWNLPFITIGKIRLEDVEVVALENIDSSEYLLGMSTLKKLGNYTIIPNENKIIIKD